MFEFSILKVSKMGLHKATMFTLLCSTALLLLVEKKRVKYFLRNTVFSSVKATKC